MTPSLLRTDATTSGGAVPVGESFTEPGLFTVRVLSREGTRLVLSVRLISGAR